ncbi:MAG: serine/threonine protein kinase [Anaerolineae bacterium]|nr:serine/threonine protein kinase [Anaerolineae bacterium]
MLNTTLNNRYQIRYELGNGGMGKVFLALDTYLEREVAVKLLNRPNLGAAGRALLLNEARAAARLSHPNIVMVFDVGEQDDMPYIVMEYVSGRPLSEQKPRRLDEVIRVARQICAALDHAHQKDLVHRDVKPHNVILIPEGVAKLMDFGLARMLGGDTEGTVSGTISYIAPEQIMGKTVNHAADLYSFGILLYELATGRLPFVGDPGNILYQHINQPPMSPREQNPNVPSALNELILHLLQKEPENRPDSAQEVGQILEVMSNLYRMQSFFDISRQEKMQVMKNSV